MAGEVFGILGQAAPLATQLDTIYTVPNGVRAHVRIVATNRENAATTFRVAISPEGAATQDKHYIAYDQTLNARDSLSSASIALEATDIVRVYSTNGLVSFQVVGFWEEMRYG